MSFPKKRFLLSGLLAVGAMFSPLALPVSAQPDLPPGETVPTEKSLVQHSFLVSPDSRFVAGIVHRLGRENRGSLINLWEVESGRLLWQKTSPVNFAVQGFYSPDGKRLIFHGVDSGPQGGALAKHQSHLNIWSVPAGDKLLELKLPEGEDLLNLALTPDGQRLIGVLLRRQTGVRPRFMAQEWEVATGKLLKAIEDKPQLAVQGSWLAGEGRLLTNHLVKRRSEGAQGVQGQFDIWSLPELQLLHSLPVGEDIAYSKALSPDGKRVAFALFRSKGGVRGTYLWNTEEEKPRPLTFAEGFDISISDFQFTPDSQTLIGAVNNSREGEFLPQIRFWDAQTAQTRRSFRIPFVITRESRGLYTVRIFPDGKQFLIIGGSDAIELRSLEDGELIRTFEEWK